MPVSKSALIESYASLGFSLDDDDGKIITFRRADDELILFHCDLDGSGEFDARFIVEDAAQMDDEVAQKLHDILLQYGEQDIKDSVLAEFAKQQQLSPEERLDRMEGQLDAVVDMIGGILGVLPREKREFLEEFIKSSMSTFMDVSEIIKEDNPTITRTHVEQGFVEVLSFYLVVLEDEIADENMG